MPMRRKRREVVESGGKELVFALAGPVGIDFGIVSKALRAALSRVAFTSSEIRLSSILHEFPRWAEIQGASFEDDRIEKHMNAGTAFRQLTGRGDALAVSAISAIRDERAGETGDEGLPRDRHAYILRSLKHPREVETLRRIYGRRFFLISASAPKDVILKTLASKIASSRHSPKSTDYLDRAQALIQKDEKEREQILGQNLRDTFPMGDLFISVTPSGDFKESLIRFIEAIFGYQFHTPRKEEYGMFHAQAAALRSAALGRQVGAAIGTSGGDIIAVGTNEVPRGGGGLYWDGDHPDVRDHQLGQDPSNGLQRRVLGDLLSLLKGAGWLADGLKDKAIARLIADAVDEPDAPLKGSHFMSGTQFMRAVHSEMASIVDAARRGVSVDGAIMYVTTFPCHDCAKHIVASGISQVFYLEPYPKSLAAELYPDSVTIDTASASGDSTRFQPFMGVAPRQYIELFTMSKRKDDNTGEVVDWIPDSSVPRGLDYPFSFYSGREALEWREFVDLLDEKGLKRGGD